jgi:hypothetical protein
LAFSQTSLALFVCGRHISHHHHRYRCRSLGFGPVPGRTPTATAQASSTLAGHQLPLHKLEQVVELRSHQAVRWLTGQADFEAAPHEETPKQQLPRLSGGGGGGACPHEASQACLDAPPWLVG